MADFRDTTARSTVIANFTVNHHNSQHREPKTGVLEVFAETGFIAAAAWKKRTVVLSNKQLLVYKKEKQDGKPLLVMDLDGCGVKQYVSRTRNNCFQVYHPSKADLILRASSQQEMEEWMQAVQSELSSPIARSMEKITTTEIQPSDLDWTMEVLGKGGSGLVKKGLWLKSIPVAIKTLNNLPEFIDEDELESFFKEMAILSDMRHPNVVSMFGFCRKENYICLVTEYITGGDLSSCLKDKSRSLLVNLKVELALNISAAMIYLHGRNLIHRDLKPGNILVEDWEAGKVKVCDFGLSRIKSPDEKTMTVDMFGSPAYAAPELNSPSHTNKVDVFSFGIILWEVDTRQPAWSQLEKAWEITEAISRGDRMEVAPGFLGALVKRCWDQDPNKRPGFNEIFDELQEQKKRIPPLSTKQNSRENLPPSQFFGKKVLPILPTSDLKKTGSSMLLTPQLSPTPVNDVYGKRVLSGFKQPVLSWDAFVQIYTRELGNPHDSQVQQLKWVLTEGGTSVQKSQFEKFLKWFSPLVPEFDSSTYANVNGAGPVSRPITPGMGGYTTSQIADIVGPVWFHGWLSADASKDSIGAASEGTFLFRFSQNPRCYSLSVMHLGNVTHWRITSSKDSDTTNAVFQIDNRNYASIQDIVVKHAAEPLKVFQLLSTGKEDVFLKKEFPRVVEQDSNYANVPRRP